MQSDSLDRIRELLDTARPEEVEEITARRELATIVRVLEAVYTELLIEAKQIEVATPFVMREHAKESGMKMMRIGDLIDEEKGEKPKGPSGHAGQYL